MPKNKMILSKRCEKILNYLWSWKIASTATLTESFFRQSTVLGCYRRLTKLERGKYIQSFTSKNGKGYLWTLDKKGFESLKDQLPPLNQIGYLSESPGHDLIVQALQLGDWLHDVPPKTILFTEQSLRRLDRNYYPSWVPKSQIHRPDGYTYLKRGEQTKLIAYEVELNQKTLTDYETVASFYAIDAKANDVLWVFGKRMNAERIFRILSKGTQESESKHNVVLLEDFITNGWQSTIRFGRYSGKTISQLHGNSLVSPRSHVTGVKFFDTRKFPKKSATKPHEVEPHFFQLNSHNSRYSTL